MKPSVAQDHALILKAICAGVAEWQPAGQGGWIHLKGDSWPATLDDFGCPLLYSAARVALRAALQSQVAEAVVE